MGALPYEFAYECRDRASDKRLHYIGYIETVYAHSNTLQKKKMKGNRKEKNKINTAANIFFYLCTFIKLIFFIEKFI